MEEAKALKQSQGADRAGRARGPKALPIFGLMEIMYLFMWAKARPRGKVITALVESSRDQI